VGHYGEALRQIGDEGMSRPVEVRTASIDDVDALVDLWLELAATADFDPEPAVIRDQVTAMIERETSSTLLALDEDVPVGFVYFTVDMSTPISNSPAVLVSGMHVSDGERRRGVGAALLEAVVATADAVGAAEISVSVPPEMRAANRYLAKLGFAPVLVQRATTTDALRERLAPTQTRTRRAVLRARKAARQPVTAVSRVLQSETGSIR